VPVREPILSSHDCCPPDSVETAGRSPPGGALERADPRSNGCGASAAARPGHALGRGVQSEPPTVVQGNPWLAQRTPNQGTPDQGTPGLGTPDQGTPDQGTPDLGTPDLGTPDQGTPDLGTPLPHMNGRHQAQHTAHRAAPTMRPCRSGCGPVCDAVAVAVDLPYP
jgi:hypothetical protein